MGRFTDKLVGKKIVVVGGTSGIGYGAASAFLASGALVTVISSSAARVEAVVSRLAAEAAHDNNSTHDDVVLGAVADVRDEAAFVAVLRGLAPVDHVVISSVDRIIRGRLAEMELEEARWLFGVKFWGAVVVGKGPAGSLTLTSGMAAIKPGPDASVGGALNGAVLSLTVGLATDLAAKKIRVNTVAPGLVKTELWDKQGKSKEQQEKEFAEAAERLPVGFVASPEDIAEGYLFCVRADYATGALVKLDGGVVLWVSSWKIRHQWISLKQKWQRTNNNILSLSQLPKYKYRE